MRNTIFDGRWFYNKPFYSVTDGERVDRPTQFYVGPICLYVILFVPLIVIDPEFPVKRGRRLQVVGKAFQKFCRSMSKRKNRDP